MLKKLIYGVLLTLQVLAEYGYGQELVYRSFKTEDGLPSNTVYSIFSSKEGFLYITTENGIAKFDGTQFQYLPQHSALKSTAHSWLKEHNGKIIGYSFGENFIEIRNDSVVPTFQRYLNRYPIPSEIQFTFTPEGNVVYANSNGLFLFKESGPNQIFDFKQIKTAQNDTIASAFNPFIDQHNQVWVIVDKTILLRVNLNSYSDYTVIPLKITQSNTARSHQIRLFPFNNNLYVLVNNFIEPKLYRVHEHKLILDPISDLIKDIQSQILNIYNEDDKALWISSFNGIHAIHIQNGLPIKKRYLVDRAVNHITIDREKNYWFSLLNEGIIWIGDIESVQWESELSKNQQSKVVTFLKEHHGVLYAGNNKGLLGVFDRQNESWKWVDTKINRNFETVQSGFLNDQLFISGGGLYAYSIPSNSKRLLSNSSVKSISIIDSKSLALATHGTIEVLTFTNQQYQAFDKRIVIDDKRSHAVLKDSFTSWVYAATSDGLKRFKNNDPRTLEVVYTSDSTSIFGTSLVQAADSSIWIGTKTEGLYRVRTNGFIEAIPTSNHFDKIIYNKLSAYNDLILASTNDGIHIYHCKTFDEQIITISKGLIAREVNDCLVTNNQLFVATSNGIQRLNLDNAMIPSIEPKTYIRSFISKEDHIDLSKSTIEFTANDFPLEINFGTISFRHNERIRYRYRLSGLSEEWSETGRNAEFVRFFSLPANAYTFEVVSINGDGIMDSKGASVSFSILPPFWQQAWFLTLVFTLFGLILMSVIKWREKRLVIIERSLNEREQLLQELRISQLSAIKAQMNPHFIFNALNSIQTFIFKNDRLSANTYLGKFSDLMRLILKQSNETGISLENELKALRLYLDLEAVRFKDQLSYHIMVDEIAEPDRIFIPSMLIQPYVENSIKHGLLHKKTPGTVWIRFKKEHDLLNVEIEDNGVGRVKAAEIQQKRTRVFESFSSKANEKRLEILNQGLNQNISVTIIDLTDSKGEGIGTLVKLSLPILKNESDYV